MQSALPLHGVSAPPPVIDGMSSRALAEIARLERTRNYLRPGDTATAVRRWRDHRRRSERQLWDDDEWGNVHWYCCGSPLDSRALLDSVLRALSPRSARELRRVIDLLDSR